jgi:hypothetical protein
MVASRSLPGLSRCRAGLRGLPTAPRRHRPSPRGKNRNRAALGPWLPSRALAAAPGRISTSSRGIRPGGADIASRLAPRPDFRAPYHPSTDPEARRRCQRRIPGDCHRASTPARIAARFGPEEPSSRSRSVLVVSHHLDGFLRSEVAGLLHPAAGHGVRCVSGSRFPGSAAVLWPEPYHGREDRHRPRSASHTPRRNPRQQPHHVTVAVAPLPFENDPPRPETTHRCQYTAASSARPPRRLRGLAPPSSSDDPRPLPAGDAPCPSMGFAPLQGPSWTPASERGPCRATRPCPTVSMAKTSEDNSPERHRSVPYRSDLSLQPDIADGPRAAVSPGMRREPSPAPTPHLESPGSRRRASTRTGAGGYPRRSESLLRFTGERGVARSSRA